jgi:hypothetical protein
MLVHSQREEHLTRAGIGDPHEEVRGKRGPNPPTPLASILSDGACGRLETVRRDRAHRKTRQTANLSSARASRVLL